VTGRANVRGTEGPRNAVATGLVLAYAQAPRGVKMAELSLAAGDRRPTVRIVACHASERDLQPILWGLEEEGIPAEVEIALDGDAATLAKQAAQPIFAECWNCTGRDQGRDRAHHRDLEGESPLFRLAMRDAGQCNCESWVRMQPGSSKETR